MHAGWVLFPLPSSSPSPCVAFFPGASSSSFILFPHATLLVFLPLITKNRQYYYYYLTVEGIDYLRQYLNLPQDVVPQTHSKKEGRPARPAGFADRGDRPEGERERRPFDKEKRLGPDGSFAPSFGGGGFGRGGGGNREGGYRG
jgi:small subunit ribosomal protein S10e